MTRDGGYLLIDNRHAPGPGGVTFQESATYTCSHCNSIVVVNPSRTRERARCWNCDHVICDGCAFLAKTQACVPMARRLEEAQTKAIRDGKG